MFRSDPSTDKFEGYNGATWVILGTDLITVAVTDYSADISTTAISNHDYGAITDADTITIDYEDSFNLTRSQLLAHLSTILLFKNNNIIY